MTFKKLLSKQAIKINQFSNQIKIVNQTKKVTKDNMLVNSKTNKVYVSPYHVQPFKWTDCLNRK